MSTQRQPSAVQSATLALADNSKSSGAIGVKVVLDVTAVPGIDTVQLTIENLDPVSGKYLTVLSAAARVATGTDVLTVFPGAPATANISANDFITNKFRVRVIHSAASAFTYSVYVEEV